MTSVEMHYDFQANQGLKKVSYALEKKTGKMYRTHVYNLDYPDDPDYYFMAYQLVSGYLVQYYTAEQLREAREKKKLSGELDKIASTLQEEDNGVLMIIDFPSPKADI